MIPSTSTVSILLIEDDLGTDAALTIRGLESGAWPFTLVRARDLASAREIILQSPVFDVIIADLALPDSAGFETIRTVRAFARDAPLIVLTDQSDEGYARTAIREGAHDCLVRGPTLYPVLPRIVRYTVERHRMLQRQVALTKERDLVLSLVSRLLSISAEKLAFLYQDGTVKLASAAFSRMIGDREMQAAGQPFARIFDAADRPRVEAMFNDCARRGSGAATKTSLTLACGTESPRTCTLQLASLTSGQKVDRHFIARIDPLSTEEAPRDSRTPPGGQRDAAWKKQLERRGGKLIAGRLEMIGLSRIRTELGSGWSVYAERIRELAVQVIKRHLGPEDLYDDASDDEFLICFADATEADATSTAQEISREILEAVFGAGGGAAGDPALDLELLGRSAEIRPEAFTADLSDDPRTATQSIAGLILERMNAARDAMRRNAQATLNSIAEHYALRAVEPHTADNRASRLCFAVDNKESRAAIEKLEVATGQDPAISAQIDMLHLAGAANLLSGRTDTSVVMAAVTMPTVASPEHWKGYLEVCGPYLRSLKSRAGLILKAIPQGMDETEIGRSLEALMGISRLQGLELTISQLMKLDIASLNLGLVTLRYAAVAPYLMAIDGPMTRSVRDSLQRARAIVTDVPNQTQGKLLLRLGARAFCLDPHAIRFVGQH